MILLAAATSDVPGSVWVTVGGAVVVAVLTGIVTLVVRLARTPVEVRDLWAENRALRADIEALSVKVDSLIEDRETQLSVNRIMGEGFDALSNYVERESELAGRRPRFSHREHDAIERARALRDEDTKQPA